MAEFAKISLGDALPSEFTNLLTGIKSIAAAGKGVLEGAKTGLNTTKPLLGLATEKLDLVGTIANQLQALLGSLDSAGLFLLPLWNIGSLDAYIARQIESHLSNYVDKQYAQEVRNFMQARYSARLTDINDIASFSEEPTSLTKLGNTITNALEDKGDPFSPVNLVDKNSTMIMLIVFAAVNDFTKILDAFNLIEKLFGQTVTELTAAKEDALAVVDFISGKDLNVYPPEDETSEQAIQATPPDFRSISVKDITFLNPIFETVETSMLPLIRSLSVAANINDSLTELVAAVEAKIAKIDSLIDQLDNALSTVTTLLSASGLYGSYIIARGGVEDLKSQLRSLTTSEGELQREFFMTGAAYLATGPSVEIFQTLFGFLGE